jgi:nicotinamide-nucleotide amidase
MSRPREPAEGGVKVPDRAISDQGLARLAARVGHRLRADGQRVTAAESCTGGWIAKALTDIAGSSQWFDESFVTYSNAAKHERLGVAGAVLLRHGAVSEPVVRAMARGALRATGADWAVAVSGIAGPDGGTRDKPVGTVWLCWANRRGRALRFTTERRRFRGDREAVRRKTVLRALQGLLAR